MEKRTIGQKVLTVSAMIIGGWLFLWLLGPVLLPFAVGLAVARMASSPVDTLNRRLPRWLAAGICVSGIYAALGLGLGLLCKLLCREASELVRTLPTVVQGLAAPAQRLEQQLLRLAGRFPDGIGHGLTEGISEFFRGSAGLAGRLYNALFSLASAVLKKTPDLALFLLTAVLSSFMLAAKLPQLQELCRKKLPSKWRHRLQQLTRRLKQTLGAWCKTQLKLLSISFLVLTAGFLILQVPYPFLCSLGIAILDALPVLGSGMILIPWGLLQFLQGNTITAVGLLILYGVTALLRTALEPQMLGRQMGLDPLLTLLALYGGYHFVGVVGMILFPVGALLVQQVWCGEINKNNS